MADQPAVVPFNFLSQLGPYYAADLRQAYDYPSFTELSGAGVTIGILMAGDWNETGFDMLDYFNDELASAHVPHITTVNIGGGLPFNASISGETHLDIQQSAGMALGVAEVLYNLHDLSPAVALSGLTVIAEDNAADVVNMSFGYPEVGFLPVNNNGENLTWILKIMHSLFLQGNAQGITFVASSGDHGAIPPDIICTGCSGGVALSVECPACDPDVTAVGGTNLVTSFTKGSLNSTYGSENANPDRETTVAGEIWGSGGGISVAWAKPTWQKTPIAIATTPGVGRTVPDLALHMGGCQPSISGFQLPCGTNRSSDWEWIGGVRTQVIGTSASSPDIAGLVALMVNLKGGSPTGRQGNFNPYIYMTQKANGATAFHHARITGSNGGPNANYTVKVPYDLVIGNGTVNARVFMGATKLLPSGTPGSLSNP